MKHLLRTIAILVVAALLSLGATSCLPRNAVTHDDDEWSINDINSENLLLNGEIELDDYER